MTATFLFSNNATSTLAGGIGPTDTSVFLAPGTGTLFPIPAGGQQYALTFSNTLTNEIVYVTGMSGDQITSMVRGQEGTSATSWIAGTSANSFITAGVMTTLIQSVSFNPSRIVTLSGVFVMTTSDYAVGLNRTTSVATSSTTLPSSTVQNQSYTIEDLSANFNAFPVTVFAPAGQTIAGLPSVTLNINRSCYQFRYYGSNIWSVDGL